MVDTCRIERQQVGSNGEPLFTTDPDTGESVPVLDEVYEGKCRLQSQGDWGDDRDIGEAGVVLIRVILQLPLSVVPEINDVVTITASSTDPGNVDRVWRVRSQFNKTHATMRRVILVDPTG